MHRLTSVQQADRQPGAQSDTPSDTQSDTPSDTKSDAAPGAQRFPIPGARRPPRLAAAIGPMLTALGWALMVALLPGHASAWSTAHGDPDNSHRSRSVSPSAQALPSAAHELGGLGWDAGPVTGADGTVYVATLAGQLHAFARDGTPRWQVALGDGLWAEASPAVGADGSIYVIGRRLETSEQSGASRHLQVLHKFSPTGAPQWRRGLPSRPTPYLALDQGIAHSAPRLWRHGDTEVLMIGVTHGLRRAEAATMLAYSATTGDLIDTVELGVDPDNHDVTGGSNPLSDFVDAIASVWDKLTSFSASGRGCDWFDCRIHAARYDRLTWRVPEIGIKAAADDRPPEVIVTSDVRDHLTQGFLFDPVGGFTRVWAAAEQGRVLGGVPMLLSNRIAGVGLLLDAAPPWKVTIGGPDGAARQDVNAPLYSGMTQMADGRIAMAADFRLTVAHPSGTVQTIDLDGRTYASPAASCSHLYVGTSRRLLSLDRRTLAVLADFPILGGGTTGPVVGPLGDLHHAIQTRAGGTLLMFWPGPEQPAPGTAGNRFCTGTTRIDPGLPPLEPARS